MTTLSDPFDGYDAAGEAEAFYATDHDDDDYVMPPTSAQAGECERCGGTGVIPRADFPIPNFCSCRAGEQAANGLSIG